MHIENYKLGYSEQIRKRFLLETKCYLERLIRFGIYSKNIKLLVDESGKRLYFTSNEDFNKDANIITKISQCHPEGAAALDAVFMRERNLRLVSFLNIPPLQLELILLNYFELIRRQLLFWAVHHLFVFKLRRFCLKQLGVGFNHAETALVAHDVYVDRMSPSLIFIEDRTTIGARSILQTHGMKSDKGFGSCYTIGPIYMMEGADIGSDCILLPGIIVGKGCALYPMTVVKKDVSPVYAEDGGLYPVTYNQNEEYPYRLNLSLEESKVLGAPSPICFKYSKGRCIFAGQDVH